MCEFEAFRQIPTTSSEIWMHQRTSMEFNRNQWDHKNPRMPLDTKTIIKDQGTSQTNNEIQYILIEMHEHSDFQAYQRIPKIPFEIKDNQWNTISFIRNHWNHWIYHQIPRMPLYIKGNDKYQKTLTKSTPQRCHRTSNAIKGYPMKFNGV